MGTPIVSEVLTLLIQNKLFGHILLLAFLMVDGSISVLSGDLFYGFMGSAFNVVINNLGIPIAIGSEHILILAIIIPLFFWALNN